ncbi:hypothetical protein [Kitasatospora cinereorecta]|uniref:Secreted protein n=1 Tax=Kitasatospora cinereorecta TaxID=285560 RepID=A0ABW0V7I0_9ACTN
MKKTTALAALSMAGLALSASPAAAAPSAPTALPARTGLPGLAQGLAGAHGVDTPTGQAEGTGFFGSTVTTTDLCHRDLEQYPIVGPLADRSTGACEALGTTVDNPPAL